MRKPSRNTAVDTVRLAALMGICVVNLPFLALPAQATMLPSTTLPDQIAALIVETLFQSKFFLLFSFLFGWGMNVQERSALRAGVSFAGLNFRRLLVLAVLGCLHAVFVFTGDILLIYAILGVLAWPLRGLPARTLVCVACAMLPVAMLCLAVLVLVLSGQSVPVVGNDLGGSFVEAARTRLAEWPQTLGFLLLFQGPLALGAILLGLASAKADFFAQGSATRAILRGRRPWLLSIGLVLNLAYAAASSGLIPPEQELLTLAGFVGLAIGAPMLAAVYLDLLLVWNDRAPLGTLLVSAGQNSLSVYVLQGLIGGLVFGGYGLHLFGQIGLAGLVPMAVLVAGLAILIVGEMARQAERGPLEAVLRRMTYGSSATAVALQGKEPPQNSPPPTSPSANGHLS